MPKDRHGPPSPKSPFPFVLYRIGPKTLRCPLVDLWMRVGRERMLKTGIVSSRPQHIPSILRASVSDSFNCKGEKLSGRPINPLLLRLGLSSLLLSGFGPVSRSSLQASTSWAPLSPREWSRAQRVPSAPQPRASNQRLTKSTTAQRERDQRDDFHSVCREVHSLITGTGLQFAEAGVEASCWFLGVLSRLAGPRFRSRASST